MSISIRSLAISAVVFGTVAAANAVVITQSVSQSIVPGSVACHAGGVTSDNGYSRGFTLSDYGITQPFNVSAVQFGVEVATAGGAAGSQSMTVNLYDGWTLSAGVLTFGTLAGSAAVTVTDGSLFIQNAVVSGTINSGFLAVEIDVPNAIGGSGNSFFIGSNDLGQTGPSFIRSAGCSLPNNTDLAAIGFPNMHIVMNVEGSVVPEPATMAALGLGALALIRRRRN